MVHLLDTLGVEYLINNYGVRKHEPLLHLAASFSNLITFISSWPALCDNCHMFREQPFLLIFTSSLSIRDIKKTPMDNQSLPELGMLLFRP
jgi:hypothetical protein